MSVNNIDEYFADVFGPPNNHDNDDSSSDNSEPSQHPSDIAVAGPLAEHYNQMATTTGQDLDNDDDNDSTSTNDHFPPTAEEVHAMQQSSTYQHFVAIEQGLVHMVPVPPTPTFKTTKHWILKPTATTSLISQRKIRSLKGYTNVFAVL